MYEYQLKISDNILIHFYIIHSNKSFKISEILLTIKNMKITI